ncbi:MAG TPA: cytochrome c oxidase subunit I [Candidatus Limnocylindria bacterium]
MTATALVKRPRAFAAAGVLRTVDHKDIGILYVLLALAFLAIGGVEALLLRVQLASSGLRVLDPSTYDQLFTMHGITMIFLVAIPILVGFANYVVPLQIGAADVAFPRLNALSFWLTLFGGVLLYLSFFAGGAPDAGWFAYAPLTERPFAVGSGMDWYVFGLLVSGVGTLIGAINLAVTILLMRCPGMVMGRVPMFTWMVLITSVLILGAYPLLTSGLVMLLVDRQLGGRFFDPAGGGNAVLWQHLFWSFGHPEVYIVVLPAFGMISEIVPVFSGKPLFGYRFVAGSGIAIGFLSFSVWVHHMFAVGLGDAENAFFSLTSMLIAVPTGVKVLNWLATMWRGRIRLALPMVFAIGFIATFVIGGLTGVSLALVPIDLVVTDTYYVVGHLHYVLFGGTIMAVFAGLYYWFPKVTGRMPGRRLGLVHFWLTLAGLTFAFLPMHWLGVMGMPRRVWTYAPGLGWEASNLVSTAGAFLMAAGAVVLAVNVWRSVRAGEPAGDDPWDAYTLEWATSSPPPAHNFESVPQVRGKRPLWDRKHPSQSDPG